MAACSTRPRISRTRIAVIDSRRGASSRRLGTGPYPYAVATAPMGACTFPTGARLRCTCIIRALVREARGRTSHRCGPASVCARALRGREPALRRVREHRSRGRCRHARATRRAAGCSIRRPTISREGSTPNALALSANGTRLYRRRGGRERRSGVRSLGAHVRHRHRARHRLAHPAASRPSGIRRR